MGAYCDGQEASKSLPNQLPNAEDYGQQYFDEAIFFNEQPFIVKGDSLKKLLHRSIGALTFQDINKKKNAGSAALISKDLIFTAAHNVYSKALKSFNSKFRFYLGADGVGEEYHEVDTWRIPQAFQECKVSSKLEHDYAIMKLKKPIIFDIYLSLAQVCTKCLEDNKSKVALDIYGFPCSYPCPPGSVNHFPKSFQGNFKALDSQGNKIKLYQYGLTRQDKIVLIDPSEFKIGYTITTLPGQSGCPVVQSNRIIALHVGGGSSKEHFNFGRIVDQSLLRNVETWGKQLCGQELPMKKKENCNHHQKQEEKEDKDLQKRPQQALILPRLGLKTIDLSKRQNITKLNLQLNSLKQINLKHCPNLESLKLSFNPLLNVDISNNTKLINVQISNNALSTIDLRANVNIATLNLSDNIIWKIDLRANLKLTQLLLNDNNIQEINLSFNIHLRILNISNNHLTSINTCSNTQLKSLNIDNNQLARVWLFIGEEVEYNDYIKSFTFSDQQSSACQVLIKCNQEQVEEVLGKAVKVSKKWRQLYTQQDKNKHKCAYTFGIL